MTIKHQVTFEINDTPGGHPMMDDGNRERRLCITVEGPNDPVYLQVNLHGETWWMGLTEEQEEGLIQIVELARKRREVQPEPADEQPETSAEETVVREPARVPIPRTQEEILKRFQESQDMFGTQRGDLIDAMEFDNAKEWLTDEATRELWEESRPYSRQDVARCIIEYVDFAQEKYDNQRGLSIARAELHFEAWSWLMGEEFYQKVRDSFDGTRQLFWGIGELAQSELDKMNEVSA